MCETLKPCKAAVDLARRECADLSSDCACWRLEPADGHDYRLPLPEWMTPEQWQRHVEYARQEGLSAVKVDCRTGERLDEAEPHGNKHRMDFYPCPRCGTRTGCVDTRCPDCGPVGYSGGDRHCLLTQGKRCEHFERAVLPLSEHADREDARKAKRAYEGCYGLDRGVVGREERCCPDCEAPLAKGRRYCDSCREKRRRAASRESQRRRRQVSTVS
ncbi:MAG: hypothetical protein GX591_11770 [Planctomycetes bacterium]|nr:hypothetical protein [Planctomycetota bacterium]